MLIESDDLIATFDLQIAMCCHERNPKTMCFDCQQNQKTVDTIKNYALVERINLGIARREAQINNDSPWGFPPFGACPVGAMPNGE